MTASPNLAASIHQRLLNTAKAQQRPFNEILQRYTMERFLYRLSQSPYQTQLVLKGALMFVAWGAPFSRPTRDMDFLAYADNTVAQLETIAKVICAQPVEADGLVFDPASVQGEKIKEQDKYEGVRLHLKGHLGQARVTLQIDVGFADVITPAAEWVAYPVLLDLPAPRLRGYSRETVIAEKTQALVRLGNINSRMKDFYDLWLLAQAFAFDGSVLAEALRLTFARRETEIPLDLPVALTAEFAQAKQKQWEAFLTTSQLTNAPQDFEQALAVVRALVAPVLGALVQGENWTAQWPVGGPWQV